MPQDRKDFHGTTVKPSTVKTKGVGTPYSVFTLYASQSLQPTRRREVATYEEQIDAAFDQVQKALLRIEDDWTLDAIMVLSFQNLGMGLRDAFHVISEQIEGSLQPSDSGNPEP